MPLTISNPFPAQLARIMAQLKSPSGHVQGPQRPSMTEQEAKLEFEPER